MNYELKNPVEIGRMPKADFDYERVMDTAYAIDDEIGWAVHLSTHEENGEMVVRITSYDTAGPDLGELDDDEIKRAKARFEKEYYGK